MQDSCFRFFRHHNPSLEIKIKFSAELHRYTIEAGGRLLLNNRYKAREYISLGAAANHLKKLNVTNFTVEL